ncbi:MAG: hypothetical protein Q9195_004733 [Heterodermia aff. obscurata]
MSSLLPPGFEDLYQASTRINGEVNIMGRVTDHLSATPSRGKDMMSTFSIADASHGAQSDEGLKIRFFKPSEDEHPQIRGKGDVVLLRKVRIKEWKNVAMGISQFTTSWIVFPAAEIPLKAPQNRLMIKHIKSPQTNEPTHSEMLYAIELCNLGDRTMDKPSGIPISSTETHSTFTAPSTGGSADAPASSSKTNGRPSQNGRDKFSLVKDLQVQSFYDIVGQVVKMYSNFGRLELYVTDYTANNMLYRHAWGQEDGGNSNEHEHDYGSSSASKSKKWPGPYGQMTLMVTLWPPHSNFAQSKVNDWDFVLLQNVHIKQDRDLKMEGALHEDRFWPSKVQISVLGDHSDERVKNVLRRKLEYTHKFNAQSEALIREARRQNNHPDAQGAEKPLSKSAARRKRKLEKEKLQQATKEETSSSSKKQKKNHSPPAPPIPKPPHTDLNKNVHCSHHTIPTTPLASILALEPTHQTTTSSGITHTLPFQNLKTRTTVRVVDFFPPNIADFSVRSRRKSEFDALSDYESESEAASISGNETEDETQKWEWRFALTLEAASPSSPPARLTAYIAQQDGDFLLKEDAVDLHTSPTPLSTLREKLFLLWGDLEERKTSSQLNEARSKPFTCCLQEYGVRSEGGWERRWRMFGVTII